MATAMQTDVERGLYEQDYHAWLQQQAALLRTGRLVEADIANLAEEIEYLSKQQQQAVVNTLVRLLLHLLNYGAQSEAYAEHNRASIREHRRRLHEAFNDSPSLLPYAGSVLAECYGDAREQAVEETGLALATFPAICPFTLEQVLDRNYLPATAAA
jgi:hypothetical protein